MAIFSRNKDKGELVLAFDIGSSSVGGVFFCTQKSGIPKIITTVREPITLEKDIDASQFLALTMKSLDIVAGKIYKAGLGAPKSIFCVLSSPWHVSQTRVIKLEKNTPFIFTAKLANELVKKEIALFEEEYLVKYPNTESKVRSIEFKNIKTMLNGYETPNPLNQKAKELEMTIFISISPEQVLKKVEETIRSHFNFEDIKFSSFILSSFSVVRDMYIHNEDFLLVEIGGEVTDIAMAKKNVLRESISFPFGRNFIIRKVASILHSSLDEAKSFISLLKDGHASVPVVKKVTPVIDKLKMEWLGKFQESLVNLTNDISIPATIYIAVDKDFENFFCQIIETEQFNQYTLTESKFKIIFLSTELFHGMAEFQENIVRDPFLIIDSIYINRFFS